MWLAGWKASDNDNPQPIPASSTGLRPPAYIAKAAMGLSKISHHSSLISHPPSNPMRRIYEQIIDLRPAILGTGTTVALDHINNAVGILVGLATLVYLIIRISRELRK